MNIDRRSLDICSQAFLSNVCLCGHPYCKASYMFGFEIWSYSQRGYNLDENQFLDICVIQSACNVLMYPAIIKYNSSLIVKKEMLRVGRPSWAYIPAQ